MFSKIIVLNSYIFVLNLALQENFEWKKKKIDVESNQITFTNYTPNGHAI